MRRSQLRVYQPRPSVAARLRGYFERRHQGRDRWDRPEQLSCLGPRKAFCHDIIEEDAQGRPVAADIGEQDRLVGELELLPAEGLEQFVERADAAGQNSK